jgi:TP901-1 family phage major tail protein
MPAQKGKDMLIRLDAEATGTFETVAGLRTKRLAFNAASVDVTDSGSAGRWRELLAGAGVQSASVSGGGIFKDAASDAAMRQVFFSGGAAMIELMIPDFGTITGPFQITALEYSGNHDGEVTFDIALESAGLLSFVEAA